MRHLWRILILLGILAAPVGAWAVEATLHNAATANGDGGNISVADRGSVGVRVTISGTATVTFKGSTDGGTTFGNIYCTALASTTNVSSTTSTNQYTCPTGGLTHIQAPISGCSGCTVTVRANTSLASLGGAGGGGVSGDTELPDATAAPSGGAAPTAPAVYAYIVCQNSGGTYDPCVAGDNTAHDAADAGSPLKIGAKASSATSSRTSVANNDRTNIYAGIDGILITRPHANLEDRVSGYLANTDGASTAVVAAQGAGIRFCATTIIVSNSSATNVTVDLRDGTAGSVLATIPAAANMGGGSISLQTPLCTSANTAMAMDGSSAATTVAVTLIGFKTAL